MLLLFKTFEAAVPAFLLVVSPLVIDPAFLESRAIFDASTRILFLPLAPVGVFTEGRVGLGIFC